MRQHDRIRRPHTSLRFSLGIQHRDTVRGFKGEVFITVKDAVTGEVQDHREIHNLIVRDCSIILARLMKDNAEPPHGVLCLAVGTGDAGWPPVPAPTVTQRSLYAEITRKAFSTTQFIDAGGAPTAIPTNVVDFTTVFSETEAVGPLCEMGLIGGNASVAVTNPVLPPNGAYDPTVDLTTKDTLVNYLTFLQINKPATSTMTIVWRITF